jgi:hypothetical protein
MQQRHRCVSQNRRLGRGVNIIGYDPLWAIESRLVCRTGTSD